MLRFPRLRFAVLCVGFPGQADVIRMLVLLEYGGVYLDFDHILLKVSNLPLAVWFTSRPRVQPFIALTIISP